MRLAAALSLPAAAALIVALFAACLTPGAARAQEAAPERISVAYCVDCVPFHFRDAEGQPAGLIVDLWRLWSARSGIAVDFVAATWDETLRLVGEGEADAHAGLFFNEARDRFLDYGGALTRTDTHFFHHRALPPIADVVGLAAYRVGVLAGDYVEGYLKERLPEGSVVGFPDYGSLMAALRRGELRVFAADTPTGLYHLTQSRLAGQFTFPSARPLYANDWFVASREGNGALIAVIDRGMAQIAEEERREILRRWTSSGEGAADSLIVAIDRAYAPLSFLNARGQPAGLLVDLWEAWARETGRPVEFRATGWQGTLDGLRGGEADIHSGLSYSDERADWLGFSAQIYETSSGIYHRVRDSLPSDVSAFGDRVIGVWKGTFQAAALRTAHPEARIVELENTEAMIEALLDGEIDALLSEELALEAELERLGLRGEITRLPQRLFRSTIHAGVAKGRDDLLAEVDAGLAALSRGELREIEARWVPDPERRFFAPGPQATSSQIGLTEEERDWIAEHPDILLGVDGNWPPFEYFDEAGRYQGMGASVMRLLSERTGLSFEAVPDLSWTEVLDRIRERRLDILPSAAPTPERREYLNFTEPYLTFPNVVVRRTGAPPVAGLEDLEGSRVGVVEGYATHELLQARYQGLVVVPHETVQAGLLALSAGKTEAFFGNVATVSHYIPELLLGNVEIAASTPHTWELAIAVRRDWPELVSILDKALASITPEEKKEIQRRAGVTPQVAVAAPAAEQDIVGDLILVVGALAAAIVVAFALIGWLLRRSRARDVAEIYQSKQVRASAVVLVAVFISVVVTVAWFAMSEAEKRARESAAESLEAVLQTTREALRVWVGDKKREAQAITEDRELRLLTERLLILPRETEALLSSGELAELRDWFEGSQTALGSEGGSVIAPNWVVVGSTIDGEVGKESPIAAQREEILRAILRGETALVPAIRDEVRSEGAEASSMFIATPITNATDNVIAILALRFDPAKDFTRIVQLGRIGQSGETYAIDDQARLVTNSRFEDSLQAAGLLQEGQGSLLNLRVRDPGGDLLAGHPLPPPSRELPATVMAASATVGQSGTNVEGYRDYRGVTVFGAWTWDAELGLGLATEIDAEEAMESFIGLRNTLLGGLAVTALLALGLAGLAVWIGQSANRSLKRARDELEDRVEARTAELQDSEQRVRSIFENAADGIVVIGTDGVVQNFSPAAERIFGYAAEEVIGRNVSLLMPEPTRSRHDDYIARYLKTGESRIVGANREVEGLSKDGTVFPMDLAIGESYMGEERVFTGIVRDITARKEAEAAAKAAQERLDQLVSRSPAVIYSFEATGDYRPTFVSANMTDLLGYEREEYLDSSDFWQSRVHPEDLTRIEKHYARLFEEGRLSLEYRFLKKDGGYFWVHDELHLVRDDKGDPLEVVGAWNDVTARKEAENALADAHQAMRESIQYASRIQRALLPTEDTVSKYVADHFIVWQPRDVVGGDMYWVRRDRRGYFVGLFDCTGHGVPGALMTTIAVSALTIAFAETGDPARFVARVNQIVKRSLRQDKDFAESDDGLELAVCLVEPERMRMTFAAAGSALLIGRGERFEVVRGDRGGLGYRHTPLDARFTNHSIRLYPGARYYLFSDGVTDQIGGDKRRAFGRRRLIETLAASASMSLPQQGKYFENVFERYQGDERRRDDVALIGFKPVP